MAEKVLNSGEYVGNTGMDEKWLMDANDAISGSEARMYIKIKAKINSDGTVTDIGTKNYRYRMANIIKFEALIKPKIVTVPILGKRGSGHKTNGWDGTFSGTAHYNSDILRGYTQYYKETGVFPEIDISVINDDRASKLGSSSATLKNVLFDSIVLAKVDAEADYLTEEISGTFDDFKKTSKRWFDDKNQNGVNEYKFGIRQTGDLVWKK